MKKSLLLYLFILALLFTVFTYAYYSKQVAFEQEKYERLNKKSKNKIAALESKLSDANYFSLEYNENAQNYFESESSDKIIQFEKLIPVVKDQLMDFNSNPKGNPYTGQEQISENKFIINKIKVINHRWIIADYNDGVYWGEVLLKYFVNEDESISYEVIQSLLYQK
jgi:hypothetical protein